MGKIIAQVSDNDKHNDDIMAISVSKDYIFTGSYDGVIKVRLLVLIHNFNIRPNPFVAD